MIATPEMSLRAAAEVARQAGIAPLVLGDAIEGGSREVARVRAGIATQVRRFGEPPPAPCVLLSGARRR